MTALVNTLTGFVRTDRALPDIRWAHWFLRILLAAVIMREGFNKTPIAADDAASFGVPVLLWALAAVGELVAGFLLIAGGLIRTSFGDLVTRTGGALIALIVASVLMMVYWAPPVELFLYNQLHLLLLAGGLYFAFRGNAA
ncbi:MAG: hypothetical protein AAGC92_02080 [Pseudomonadota bacterium]